MTDPIPHDAETTRRHTAAAEAVRRRGEVDDALDAAIRQLAQVNLQTVLVMRAICSEIEEADERER